MKRSRALNRSASQSSRQSKAKKIRIHSQQPLDNQGYPIILLSNLQVHQPTLQFLNSQLEVKRNKIEDKTNAYLSLVKYDPHVHFAGLSHHQIKCDGNSQNLSQCYSSDTFSDNSWEEYCMDIEEPME